MRKPRSYSDLSHKQLAARLEQAQKRILELERMLIPLMAEQRRAAQRSIEQGQPLLDLAAGQEPGTSSPHNGDDEGEDEEEDQPDDSERKKRKRKPGSGRRKFPAHLPRTIKEYEVQPERDLPDYDPEQGYTIIDYDTCEELRIPRPQPEVIVHKRPVVLYTTREGEMRLATGGGMCKVFPKSAASPEVLSHIAVERLYYHQTLYRIERWFSQHGCPVARSTLSSWMEWLGVLLRPIAMAQERELKQAFVRHADDSSIRVRAKGTCDRVRVWVVLGEGHEGPEIRFLYTEERTSETTDCVLGEHRGYLQVDACGTYDALFQERPLIEVGCWSHCKRKFDDVKAVDARAKPMLAKIRELYRVESMGADLEAGARKIFRDLASRPLLSELKVWVEKQREAELLESSFKKALNYVHNQWAALTRYLEDGRLSIDNNAAEGQFHVLGVGRRNHLFWGSRKSLESGLVLFGLIQSCAANDIDPYVYLVDVIRRTVETETPARLMIPSRWRKLPPLAAEAALATSPEVQAASTG
jgi:transposase